MTLLQPTANRARTPFYHLEVVKREWVACFLNITFYSY